MASDLNEIISDATPEAKRAAEDLLRDLSRWVNDSLSGGKGLDNAASEELKAIPDKGQAALLAASEELAASTAAKVKQKEEGEAIARKVASVVLKIATKAAIAAIA